MKILMIIFSITLISFSHLIADEKKDTFWDDYQSVLQSSVSKKSYMSKDGEFYHSSIDYKKIKDDPKITSQIYAQLEKLTSANPPETEKKKLAFWINAYNFFTIVDVVNNYPVSSMKKIGWKNNHHNICGKLFSLDDMEHKMLLPLGDPRVHFAINCASVGCPALNNIIYTFDSLDKQLDKAVINALKNPLHLRSMGKDTVYTTKLFKWFKKDFKNDRYNGTEGFINAFAPQRLKGASKVRPKIDYDWNLNTKENVQKKMEEFPDIRSSKIEFWDDYQSVLQSSVTKKLYLSKDGTFYHSSIDYKKIKNDPKITSQINAQLEKLKSANPPETQKKKLAFWINAYNFFTIVDVINNYPVSSMKKIGWKNNHHNICGKLFSLDDMEHKMLLPLGDPRVHFAINCASVGCPALNIIIYTFDSLDKQLDNAVINALKNPLHLRSMGKDTVHTTKLFKWFKKDFENDRYKGTKGFINAFAPQRLKGASKISPKIDYDWNLNTKENVQKKMEEFPDIKPCKME